MSFSAAGTTVRETEQLLSHVENILSTMKDAETGQRGFVITGDESYLEPYSHALAEIPRILADPRSAALRHSAHGRGIFAAGTGSSRKITAN